MNEKVALDTVINKSRVHFYKPIQIAEILYRNRVSELSLEDLNNYRTLSKRWRDEVSLRVVGNVSTSSSRFQDNIFDDNAMPPELLKKLAEFNVSSKGVVEAYIYACLIDKMTDLGGIHHYLANTDITDFDLDKLLDLFTNNKGLRRSMDKVYEIISFALFDSIIAELDVHINVQIKSTNSKLISDFSDFTKKVVGINEGVSLDSKARVFRVGATNANDGGLDLWANFGPAIQVKHFSINSDHLNDITSTVKAEKFIVVCTDADKTIIELVLRQSGTYPKVQSIVTLGNLRQWYAIAISEAYKESLGANLLSTLLSEFEYEFPANQELPLFINERGYDQIEFPEGWDPIKEEIINA
jgi:hypothetical protein